MDIPAHTPNVLLNVFYLPLVNRNPRTKLNSICIILHQNMIIHSKTYWRKNCTC